MMLEEEIGSEERSLYRLCRSHFLIKFEYPTARN